MRQQNNTKIIGFVGLAGSGKSSAVSYLKEKQYPFIHVGAIISQLMEVDGRGKTPEDEKIFREELMRTKAYQPVIDLLVYALEQLIDSGQNRIIIDGPSTWLEYKEIKRRSSGKLTIIALLSAKSDRHQRLITRSIRPFTEIEAQERDWSEIENLNKGGVIATADYFIDNDSTIDILYQKIDNVLNSVEFYD